MNEDELLSGNPIFRNSQKKRENFAYQGENKFQQLDNNEVFKPSSPGHQEFNNLSKNEEVHKLDIEESSEHGLTPRSQIISGTNNNLNQKDFILNSEIQIKLDEIALVSPIKIKIKKLQESECHFVVFFDIYDKYAYKLFNIENSLPLYFENLGQMTVFSLRNENKVEEGINYIKALHQLGQIPKVIIAASENYFSFIIEKMYKAEINLKSIYFTVLPFGVKNDLSYYTKWGNSPSQLLQKNDIRECLVCLLSELQRATIEIINCFQIELKCRYATNIEKLEKNKIKAEFLRHETYSLKKIFFDNVSIGFEAKISEKIEEKNWNDPCCRCCEFYNGFASNICDHSIPMCDLIDRIEKAHLVSDSSNVDNYIYSSNTTISSKSKFIKGNPSALIFINIGSFLGGKSKPWDKSSKNLGLGYHREFKTNFKDQKMNDNLLEAVTYESKCSLCMEKTFGKHSMKLSQEENYCVLFKLREDPPIKTYLSIDEEYYRVTNPLTLTISPCENIPKGKIHILMKNSLDTV